MLTHESNKMRVRYIVAAQMLPSGHQVHGPETLIFACSSDMRSSQQRRDVAAGVRKGERARQYAGVSHDAQVSHDRWPEEIDQIRPCG